MRYAVRWTSSSVSNLSLNGTVNKNPVSTWTPVCVDRSSWTSSVQLRFHRLVRDGVRGPGSGVCMA